MANPNGNPDITKYGKATSFGQPGGVDPSSAGRKSASIRAAIRRMAAMDLEDFMDMVSRPERLSVAQAIAARKFQAALKGDVKAMQQLEDSVDGKVTEKQVRADITLADLVVGSFKMTV